MMDGGQRKEKHKSDQTTPEDWKRIAFRWRIVSVLAWLLLVFIFPLCSGFLAAGLRKAVEIALLLLFLAVTATWVKTSALSATEERFAEEPWGAAQTFKLGLALLSTCVALGILISLCSSDPRFSDFRDVLWTLLGFCIFLGLLCFYMACVIHKRDRRRRSQLR